MSVFMSFLWPSGLSPAGMWFIRDVHQQSEDVSKLTCSILVYLAPVSLLESIVSSFSIAHHHLAPVSLLKSTLSLFSIAHCHLSPVSLLESIISSLSIAHHHIVSASQLESIVSSLFIAHHHIATHSSYLLHSRIGFDSNRNARVFFNV